MKAVAVAMTSASSRAVMVAALMVANSVVTFVRTATHDNNPYRAFPPKRARATNPNHRRISQSPRSTTI